MVNLSLAALLWGGAKHSEGFVPTMGTEMLAAPFDLTARYDGAIHTLSEEVDAGFLTATYAARFQPACGCASNC